MKKLIIIISVCFLVMAHNRKTFFQNIDIHYLGYEREIYLKNLVLLQFEIENISNDTVYLSKKNINIKVFKNKKEINKDNPPTYLPFVRPSKNKQFKCDEKDKYEKVIKILKLKFANKLYEKNFASNTNYFSSKDLIIENIVEDCIVLLPNESIDYESGFYSKKFDKTCKISAKYLDVKRFTYFVDDSGKKIDIDN